MYHGVAQVYICILFSLRNLPGPDNRVGWGGNRIRSPLHATPRVASKVLGLYLLPVVTLINCDGNCNYVRTQYS